MKTPLLHSALTFLACLLIACGGASNGGTPDADVPDDASGSDADATLDTAGDDDTADGGATDPDTLVPDAAEPADTSTTDISADTLTPDADNEPDGGNDTDPVTDAASDAADTDTVEADTTEVDAATDAATDAGTDAADATDGGGVACEFLDLDIRILDCNGDYKYLRGWTAPFDTSGACVPYFTISGDDTRYATADDAINTTDCSPECQYVASTSVTWLYCGRRTGYIIYRDADERCGDLYEMPEGIYTSLEAHAAENPCAP